MARAYNPGMAFQLHERLVADTVPVSGLNLCEVRLMDNAAFPWLIMVPRREGASEIIDLDAGDRQLLMTEIAEVSEALRKATGCDKLNVAALGNQVPQLHVHVIARFRGDLAWPKPVWGTASQPFAPGEREALVRKIKAAVELE